MTNEEPFYNFTELNSSSRYDNTEEYVSDKTVKIILFVFPIILIPLFCLLGSVGNSLSLVVLSTKYMRNPTNYILGALCVSDTFFLAHSLLYTLLNLYQKLNPVEGEALRSKMFPYIGAYGNIVFARITSCLTTLLCAERFVAVYFPMQARFICTVRSTRIAIAVIFVTTSVMFIPFLFKYETVYIRDHRNVTWTKLNKSDFYLSNVKFYSVYGTILNIIFRFAPLIIIPILNAMMVRAVHRTWRRRRSSRNDSPTSLRCSSRSNKHLSSTDQNRITIMLLIVSFVFIICISPGALNSIATHVWTSYSPFKPGKLKNLYMCISAVTFFLETINSSINFIIYMVFNSKFRILYKEKFCCGDGLDKAGVSTSVREKFRWSSARKNSRPNDSDSFGRKTVSDFGPLIRQASSEDRRNRHWSNEIHSDCCELQNGSSLLKHHPRYNHCHQYHNQHLQHINQQHRHRRLSEDTPSEKTNDRHFRRKERHRKNFHRRKSLCDLLRAKSKSATRKTDSTLEAKTHNNGNGFSCNSQMCQQTQMGLLDNGTEL